MLAFPLNTLATCFLCQQPVRGTWHTAAGSQNKYPLRTITGQYTDATSLPCHESNGKHSWDCIFPSGGKWEGGNPTQCKCNTSTLVNYRVYPTKAALQWLGTSRCKRTKRLQDRIHKGEDESFNKQEWETPASINNNVKYWNRVNSSKNPQQFIIILTLRSTFVNSLTFTRVQDSTHRQRHQHSALHLWTFRYLSPSLAQTFNLSSRTWNSTTRIRAVTGLPRLSTCSSSRRCHSHQSASPPCQHLLSWLFPPIANTVKEELAPHYRNILLQCINNIINHNNQVQQRLSLAWWAGNDDSKSSSMNLDFHPPFLLGSYVHYSVWYTMQETVLETRSGTKLLCLSAWGLWWVRNRHWGLFLLQPEQNTRCYRWAFAELRTKFYSSGIRFNQQTYWVVWHDPQNQFWELGCCIHLTTTDYIPNPTQATHTYYSLKWR